LAEESVTPPEGISQNDWERVITYQKQAKAEAHDEEDEMELSHLAYLGPKVDDNHVVASVDGIQVRRPEKRRFHELGTAKVVTPKGYRYVSGADAGFPGVCQGFCVNFLEPNIHRRSLSLSPKWMES
jgi:hypothetical protein